MDQVGEHMRCALSAARLYRMVHMSTALMHIGTPIHPRIDVARWAGYELAKPLHDGSVAPKHRSTGRTGRTLSVCRIAMVVYGPSNALERPPRPIPSNIIAPCKRFGPVVEFCELSTERLLCIFCIF
jgi:hypothetical protein